MQYQKFKFNGYAIPFQDFIPLLKFLYSNCNSISSIIFKFSEVNFNINNYSLVEECSTQMIVSQHNLKKISFGIFYNLNLYNPFLSLKNSNCSNTLNTIVFYFINFKNIINILREVFDHLNVLESIHLINCNYLNSNFVQQIIKIRYFYTNVLDDNNIYLIIKNNQHNINYLTIAVKFYEYDTVYNELSSTVLKNLGQILSPKLEYLCLVLLFNTSDLEIFLKNSQNTFIKKLLIRNIVMYGDGDGDFNILFYIKKYIMKKERVKYLAILEEDELFFPKKEVNEFKLYNIIVQKYHDLCIYNYSYIINNYLQY
ncbi:unnamed protein product [Rhizophagus irregularis]|nr:unnamed protein product [Rhizophagus irregularis]